MPQSTVTISGELLRSGEAAKGLGVHAVAFLDPVGNVIVESAARRPVSGRPRARSCRRRRRHHNRRRSRSAGSRWMARTIRSAASTTPGKVPGRAGCSASLEKRHGRARLVDSAIDQQLGDQRRDVRGSRECQNSVRIKGLQPPSHRHSRQSFPVSFLENQSLARMLDLPTITLRLRKSKPAAGRPANHAAPRRGQAKPVISKTAPRQRA